MKALRIFLVLGFLLAGTAFPAPSEPEKPASPPVAEKKEGVLSLAVSPTQELFLKGSRIRVQLMMENRGEAPIPKKDLPSLTEGLVLLDGKTEKGFAPNVPEGDPVAERRPEFLAPGAFYGRVVDITKWFPALAKAGRYMLTWQASRVQARPAFFAVRDDVYISLVTEAGRIDIEPALERAPLGATSLLAMMKAKAFQGSKITAAAPRAWVQVDLPKNKKPATPRVTEKKHARFEEGAVIFQPLEKLKAPKGGVPIPNIIALKGTRGNFRILTRSEPALDDSYAAVGRVLRGMKLLKKLRPVKPEPPRPPRAPRKKKKDEKAGVDFLTIQSIEIKPYADRKKRPVQKIQGSLSASLSTQQQNVVFGNPIYTRFAVGNMGDWAVRTKKKISLLDGLALVDVNQKEYAPVWKEAAARIQLPQPDLVVQSGEFFGITVDMNKAFSQFQSGGDFALRWTRDKKQRALAGVSIRVLHYARVFVENRDSFLILLFDDETPKTVKIFEKLAREGFYRGGKDPAKRTAFHYVIKTHELKLVQAGGLPDNDHHRAPIDPIPYERGRHAFNEPGIVGLAHPKGQRNKGVSQFFVCLDKAPNLSGMYTAFGQVIEGMNVVRSIRRGDKIEKIVLSLRRRLRKEKRK